TNSSDALHSQILVRLRNARGSVAGVLLHPGIDVDLVLWNGCPEVRGLPADLGHGVRTDDLRVQPPAFEIEQALRLERQLPASFLADGVAEGRLRQSRERRQPSTSTHGVNRCVRIRGTARLV